MKDYAKNYLHLVTAVLPKIVLGFGIGKPANWMVWMKLAILGLTALAIIGGGLFLFCIVRERKLTRDKKELYNEYIGQEKEAWNYDWLFCYLRVNK